LRKQQNKFPQKKILKYNNCKVNKKQLYSCRGKYTTHTIITNSDISQITGMTALILRSTMLFSSRIEMRSCKQIDQKSKDKMEFNWNKMGLLCSEYFRNKETNITIFGLYQWTSNHFLCPQAHGHGTHGPQLKARNISSYYSWA
jgi:hypothetical protein